MNITLRSNHYTQEIIVKGDESTIVFDAEHREWAKDEYGHFKCIKRDIDTGALDTIHGLMCDMIHYRQDEYDSTQLIELLFEKLPESQKQAIIEKLKNSL